MNFPASPIGFARCRWPSMSALFLTHSGSPLLLLLLEIHCSLLRVVLVPLLVFLYGFSFFCVSDAPVVFLNIAIDCAFVSLLLFCGVSCVSFVRVLFLSLFVLVLVLISVSCVDVPVLVFLCSCFSFWCSGDCPGVGVPPPIAFLGSRSFVLCASVSGVFYVFCFPSLRAFFLETV